MIDIDREKELSNASNRTIVELKSPGVGGFYFGTMSSNRTIVELKEYSQ